MPTSARMTNHDVMQRTKMGVAGVGHRGNGSLEDPEEQTAGASSGTIICPAIFRDLRPPAAIQSDRTRFSGKQSGSHLVRPRRISIASLEGARLSIHREYLSYEFMAPAGEQNTIA